MKNLHHRDLIQTEKYFKNQIKELTNKREKLIQRFNNIYTFICDYHEKDEVKIKVSCKHSVYVVETKKQFLLNKEHIKHYYTKLKDIKVLIKETQKATFI